MVTGQMRGDQVVSSYHNILEAILPQERKRSSLKDIFLDLTHKVEAVKLKEYKDWEERDGSIFLLGLHCSLCGGSLPIKEYSVIKYNNGHYYYFHSDPRICIAIGERRFEE